MGKEARKLLQHAMTLPDEDRRRLAEALFDSVPRDSDEEIAAAWRGEVLGRIEEVRRGHAQAESYSEVKARLHEALKRRR